MGMLSATGTSSNFYVAATVHIEVLGGLKLERRGNVHAFVE